MDLDGDGAKDVISGSWPGELYWFRKGPRGYSRPIKLRDRSSQLLNPGSASTVFAADWDRDGDLDLLLGNIDGAVMWSRNDSGEKGTLTLAEPAPLRAAGRPITVDGDSQPIVADWDGDGRPDLLVGCDGGHVMWYRNTADKGLPTLGKGARLVPPSKHGYGKTGTSEHGTRAKICVADYNGDGRLDLLLGDFRYIRGGEPNLTLAQQRQLEKAERALEALHEELTALRSAWLDKQPKALEEMTKAERKAAFLALSRTDAYQALMTRFEKPSRVVERLSPRPGYLGNVWVFLRKAAPKTSEKE